MVQSVALVDLFNVTPSVRTRRDYEDLADLLADLIQRVLVPSHIPGVVHEVECRLYGGFTDRNGGSTEQFSQTQRQLSRLSGRRNGVRIVPHIARSLAFYPGANLRGTYKNQGQKMVDGMLSHDAYYFAKMQFYDYISIISDDDDFVPAALAIAVDTDIPVRWLRRRPLAENDRLFAQKNISFLYDRVWS